MSKYKELPDSVKAYMKRVKRIPSEDHIEQLERENAELRRQHIEDNQTINRLRETIRRGQEDYYE